MAEKKIVQKDTDLTTDLLAGRNRLILEAIIEDYISTAEPVGSRAVTRRHGLNVSPATVRNVMADLEELGFLSSPHTSAGRVPTEKAYRFYVNALLQMGQIASADLETLRTRWKIKGGDVTEVLREASRMLSSLSHYMGIVLAPRLNETIFRHIEFVKLSGRRILVVLVTVNGMVQNRIIEPAEEMSSEDLVRMGNYLDHVLQGLPIGEVKQKIVEEMQNEKTQYDTLMKQALALSEESFETEAVELIVEGQANILEQPEFSDARRMRDIFRAFEEKSQIVDLLDRTFTADGVQIFIGSETRLSHMEGMSIITTTYMSGEKKLGVLGVIGPTRMGYANVIPIVDYAGKLVSRLLKSD